MSELVQHNPQQSAQVLATRMDYAQAMAGSSLLPKQYRGQPANLLFALEYADALGVAPIHAITSIHVVEGKPTASADLIASLIRKAGHKLRIMGDDTYAEAHLTRADDPEFTFEVRWDLARARQAGLAGKAVWKQYPAAMLRSRAITEVARMGAPDALFGVQYTSEEIGLDNTDDTGFVQVVPDHQADTAPAPQQAPTGRQYGIRQNMPQAPAPDPATREQWGEMAAYLDELGVTEGDAKYQYMGDWAKENGIDLPNPQGITRDDAAKLIAHLAEKALTPTDDIVDAEPVLDLDQEAAK